MLSIIPLKSAEAAKKYYKGEKQGDYYLNPKEATELSHWWGKGATYLGLKGYVHDEPFEQCLDGILPSGQQLGRTNKEGRIHRPGYDLTFSAPKSVSILAEIGKDHRIYAAHNIAVQEALSYLEKNAIKTRAFRDDEIVFENVDNLTVAIFRHDTSREMDPDTHTHCVLLNMVQRKDGKWRSISSESLFDHKMTGGVIYRARLAIELQKLGYEIEKTHTDGRFEIKDFPKEVIQYFSTRRQQIEERLIDEGWEGGKASAKVTLDTRKRKQELDREQLHEKWQRQCAEINFDSKLLIEQSKTKVHEIFKSQNARAVDAVSYAIAHLGEREAVFAKYDIVKEALAHGLGEITLNDVEHAIKKSVQKGKLIEINEEFFTTLDAIKLEEANIYLMKKSQQQCTALSSSDEATKFILDKEKALDKIYTRGQREAIELILTTHDKVIGVQGRAGTGKTTMLNAIRDYTLSMNYDIIGITPTKNAALELQAKTNIPSITLQKYLIDLSREENNKENLKPSLLILDEASMVSSKQMKQLLQHVNHTHVRLVLIGDTKQLSAIDSGKPFDQLQKAGMCTATMSEIVRQKNQLLKEAIHDAIDNKIKDSFEKIDITEVKNKQTRLQKVVDEYLSYSVEGRTRTLVLVPANDDRDVVNKGIREGLKKEGLLQGTEMQTSTLISRNFSKTYQSMVSNYSINDIIRFNKANDRLNIKAGDYYSVERINKNRNELILIQSENGRMIRWNPEKWDHTKGSIEVYHLQDRALMAGDKIRWLRNVGDDFINAQTADVLSIENHLAEIKLQNNKIIKIDLSDSQNKHWDYAFAYTYHAKQGGENVRVIAHMESFRKKLTTQQAFYVAISRAEYHVRLIVDDRVACIKTIQKYTGEKKSALDVLNKLRQENSNFKKQKFYASEVIKQIEKPKQVVYKTLEIEM